MRFLPEKADSASRFFDIRLKDGGVVAGSRKPKLRGMVIAGGAKRLQQRDGVAQGVGDAARLKRYGGFSLTAFLSGA